MVFQSYALFPHLSIHENVAYGLRVRRVPRGEIAEKVRAILELVGLEGAGNRKPGELSGGQQQRVALARALVYDPRLLLLDEPLSNLDAKLRVYMREEIRRIQQQAGVTTIYVTHDQEEALSISDRIAVMHAGQVSQVGTPDEIYQEPASVRVADFIGQANFLPCRVSRAGSSVTLRFSSGDEIASHDATAARRLRPRRRGALRAARARTHPSPGQRGTPCAAGSWPSSTSGPRSGTSSRCPGSPVGPAVPGRRGPADRRREGGRCRVPLLRRGTARACSPPTSSTSSRRCRRMVEAAHRVDPAGGAGPVPAHPGAVHRLSPVARGPEQLPARKASRSRSPTSRWRTSASSSARRCTGARCGTPWWWASRPCSSRACSASPWPGSSRARACRRRRCS